MVNKILIFERPVVLRLTARQVYNGIEAEALLDDRAVQR